MNKKLALISLGALLASAEGFASLPSKTGFTSSQRVTSTPFSPTSKAITTTSTSTNLAMMMPSFSSVFSTSELLADTLSDSSLVQKEFVNGVTHALLDFTTLWGMGTVLVRAATVIGRLFVLGQDISPGKELLPDELAFQCALLVLACHSLASTLLPKIKAHVLASPLLTPQDRVAFRQLFRPAGLNWHQYKELSVSSMDWIHVEAGHNIMSMTQDKDDAVYWLYQGSVHVHNTQGDKLHTIPSHDKTSSPGLGLLGERKLAQLLDRSSNKSNKTGGKKSKKKSYSSSASDISSVDSTNTATNHQPPISAVAGDQGATLLRMNTTQLAALLQHDTELSHSMSRLAFQGMQDKLDALLLQSITSSSSTGTAATVAATSSLAPANMTIS